MILGWLALATPAQAAAPGHADVESPRVTRAAPARLPFDVALYAKLLARYTHAVPDTAGVRVDYAGLAASPDWPRLVASLSASRPATLRTRNARLAFWIDAYNILAIDLVVRHYPVSSIKDIGSFFWPVWKIQAGRIGGHGLTLDDIEDGILRPMGDPRIHAAIVCASTSCPSLRREPYLPARLDAQLDDAMRRFLGNPAKGLALEPGEGQVRLSPIFHWFRKDFATAGGVLAFVRRYAPPRAQAWLAAHPSPEVTYFDYNWTLNGLAPRGAPKAGG